jgi:hypothetical protein
MSSGSFYRVALFRTNVSENLPSPSSGVLSLISFHNYVGNIVSITYSFPVSIVQFLCSPNKSYFILAPIVFQYPSFHFRIPDENSESRFCCIKTCCT